MALALEITSAAFSTALLFIGPTSGLTLLLIARPQYAIAQLGSISEAAVNALAVPKKNECNMATARLNCSCAAGEHETGKLTAPNSCSLWPRTGISRTKRRRLIAAERDFRIEGTSIKATLARSERAHSPSA